MSLLWTTAVEQGTQYFHGSAHDLEPGQVLTPRHEHDRSHHVYFADSERVAGNYAALAHSRMTGTFDPTKGHVYRVEPIGPHEPDDVQEWGGERRGQSARIIEKVR